MIELNHNYYVEKTLAEYERAQEVGHHTDGIIHQVTAIVWGANTLLLGIILEIGGSKNPRLVTVMCVVGILMSLYVPWVHVLTKQGQQIAYGICREIEASLPLSHRLHTNIHQRYPQWKPGRVAVYVLTTSFVLSWLYVIHQTWRASMYSLAMTDSSKFLITLVVTVIGSGLGTAIVAALFKKQFDTKLETYKALLQRSGRIHERQVEALSVIYSKLEHALYYLHRTTSAGKFEGEPKDEFLLQKMAGEMGEASESFSLNRLLISENVGHKIDDFFGKMSSAGLDVRLALDPSIQGDQRAKIWAQAQQTAYKELPSILEAINTEARLVIHG